MTLNRQTTNRLHENIISTCISLETAKKGIQRTMKLLAPYNIDTSKLLKQYNQIDTMINELHQWDKS